ncbi:pyridoxal phosphate-dependent aminotransferase [Paenisporosarcina quisquiliarum]|uniref:Pyridoxal phosphate-dependent aminotransferase n=1 Tax=Paenisporosarcina quisquiliarum TaxID=365346 RepID=A0A9X3LGH2_9BACL|nr:pyridoxal phosphate-dependent aminotransferase [Paenisporosarcina quisquiliarum]MCZ8537530.1 pyridoxal phosphate-dependent aminotransferase [Paenisporosarcina quisquiliarum]
MELSKKLQQLPPQFFASLVQKVGAAVAEGRDVINLGQGNPDQPTPPHIVKALQEAAENPITHKYSPFRGISELKEAAADFYKREYNVDIDPSTEVAVLFGTKIGLVELPMAVLNPGDLMLLPDPGYPDYLSGVVMADVQYETLPLVAENHFLPDYSMLSEATKERAKLMYLNYPNNPTGATADLEFFNQTVAFAKENGIAVSHDFAYGAIGFDGVKPVSFLQAEGAKEIGIEMYTLSKTYNMAGWRVGFAVGNKEMIEALNLIQDHLFVSLFPAVQHAAVAALGENQLCVTALVDRYENRRNTFINACQQIGWQVEAPTGSFFAWLPVPKGYTSQEFADKLLNEADVAVAPGNGFGEFGEGYIRVGLLVDEHRLEEAVKRIGELNIF